MRRFLFNSCRRSFSTVPDLNETLILTKSCAKRIKQLQKSSKNENLVLRLSVEGGGCSGFQYVFKMEDKVKAAIDAAAGLEEDEEALDDRIFERDGSEVRIDVSSFELIKGATVDFKEELIRSAFSIVNNPQSESACGCGSSFAAKNFTANPALD